MTLQNKRVSLTESGLAKAASEGTLEVNVVFTTVEETLPAIKQAGEFARDLNASIRLLVAQIVPFPLPLNCPPVVSDFTARRFRTMVGHERLETRVQIVLCRDKEKALQDTLRRRSLVVIGRHKRWWNRGESRLVRKLRAQGHEVIYVRM